MRRLFLVRHAKAEPPTGGGDYERPLSGRGRKDAARIAGALAARAMLPDALVHSGAARTKETAEIFVSKWATPVPIEEEVGLYDAPQEALFERIRALRDDRERVALIGHNPGVGELASSLAGSGAQSALRRMQIKFPTCAVAALDFNVDRWRRIERRSARLTLFLAPSDIERGA